MNPESNPISPNSSDQNVSNGGMSSPESTGSAGTVSPEPTYQPQVIRPTTTPGQPADQMPETTPQQSVPPSPAWAQASPEPPPQTGVIYNGGDSLASVSTVPGSTSTKSFMTTFLLALLLGAFGADRYYLGKIGTGLLKMFTLGGVLIWATIDIIFILTNKTKDKNGNSLDGYEKNHKTALTITVAFVILSVISGAFAVYAISQAVKSVSETVDSVVDLAKDCPGGTCPTDTASDPAVTPLNKSVVGTGEAADLDVSIMSADVSPKTTGEPVDAGKQYVAVNFVIANSGTSDKYLPGMFYYKTPDGKLFSDTTTLSGEPTDSPKNVKLADQYKEMLSGSIMEKGEINSSYYLIFQVPKGELGQVMWFGKAFDTNSTKLAIFDLK